MIDFEAEINDIIKNYSNLVKINFINKLHYNKYAFRLESDFSDLNYKILQNYSSSTKFGLFTKIMETSEAINSVYGKDYKEFLNPDTYCWSPDNYEIFKNFLKTIYQNLNHKDFKIQCITIHMPQNSDHLEKMIELNEASKANNSFTNAKYMTGKSPKSDYPVKATVQLNGKKLTDDEIDYVIEMFETTDGIMINNKSLKERIKKYRKYSNSATSTTVYAKSLDCFGHFIFMLKPYNIKFLRTEVYQNEN